MVCNPRIALLAICIAILPCSVPAGESLSERGVVEVAQLGSALPLPLPRLASPSGGPILLPPPPLDVGSYNSSSACCADTDWIVSSRGTRQDWDECGSTCLRVYRRECGQCLQPSSMDELKAAIDPCVPTCVFIHGSYVEFNWIVKESVATSKWLRKCGCGKPVQVIHFTWPSDEDARYLPGSVRELTRRAEFNSFYLAALLGQLPIDCNCGGRLTVLGHSHGGLMTAAAMHLLAGGAIQGHTSCDRLRWKPTVILAAAAIDRDWLDPNPPKDRMLGLDQICNRGRYHRALSTVNRMVLLNNRHDFALKLYPARHLFTKQALGRVGFSRRDEARMGSALCRIREVDVSNILGCRHVWPYYLESQKISCIVAPYLQ